MFHAWDITVPANTPLLNPVKQELNLPAGVITGISIKFPSGCNGMVKIRILRWTFQLVPLSSGEWVTGDGETVPTEQNYELLETPFMLEFQGCSPSTTYPHTITVRIEVSPLVSPADAQTIDLLKDIKEAVAPIG